MVKIANFWSLLNPTLPGRVNLAKSYLYSQVSYVCSVIEPTQAQVKEMEEIIYSFIKKNDIVSRSKIFSEKKVGGLGLPPIDIFIKSLDILMFKKGLYISDVWTQELFFHCNENDKYYFTKIPDKQSNPILHRIVKNYMAFSENFWIIKGNILDMRIFNNSNFVNIFGQKLSINFLDASHRDNNIILQNFRRLKFKDLLDPQFKPFTSIEQYNVKFGFELKQNEFRNLDAIVTQNFEKRRSLISQKNFEISTFLNIPGIKSKSFRRFFIKQEVDMSNIITIKNRYNWAEVTTVDIPREINFQKCWSTSFLPMNIRDFSFKMINNTNVLNARINHRDDSVDDVCSYCIIDNEHTSNREVLEHFYGKCNTVIDFSREIFKDRFGIQNYSKDWNLLGVPKTFTNAESLILNIEIILINLFLLRFRHTNCKPTLTEYKKHYSLTLRILNKSKFYRDNYRKLSVPFDNG